MIKSIFDYDDVKYLSDNYKVMVSQKWLCVSRAILYRKESDNGVKEILNLINFNYLPNEVEIKQKEYFVLTIEEINNILKLTNTENILECCSTLDINSDILFNDIYISLINVVNDQKLNDFLKTNNLNSSYSYIDKQDDKYHKKEAYQLLQMSIDKYFDMQRKILENLEIVIYNKMPNLRRKKNEEN